MGSVDRLALVELIEAEKAKLTPEALNLWEELDTSLYLSPEEETEFKPHELVLIQRRAEFPDSDQRVMKVLDVLRAGLYDSDYRERRGKTAQERRDRCVVNASLVKDREARGPDSSTPFESMYRTVDQAIARLRGEDAE